MKVQTIVPGRDEQADVYFDHAPASIAKLVTVGLDENNRPMMRVELDEDMSDTISTGEKSVQIAFSFRATEKLWRALQLAAFASSLAASEEEALRAVM
jgi:hypothetical protein